MAADSDKDDFIEMAADHIADVVDDDNSPETSDMFDLYFSSYSAVLELADHDDWMHNQCTPPQVIHGRLRRDYGAINLWSRDAAVRARSITKPRGWEKMPALRQYWYDLIVAYHYAARGRGTAVTAAIHRMASAAGAISQPTQPRLVLYRPSRGGSTAIEPIPCDDWRALTPLIDALFEHTARYGEGVDMGELRSAITSMQTRLVLSDRPRADD